MQATMTILKGLPWSSSRLAKALMTGLQRLAVSAAMYKTLRIEALPPQMERLP